MKKIVSTTILASYKRQGRYSYIFGVLVSVIGFALQKCSVTFFSNSSSSNGPVDCPAKIHYTAVFF